MLMTWMWLLILGLGGWSLMSIWNHMVYFFHLIQVSWIFLGISLIIDEQKRRGNQEESIYFFIVCSMKTEAFTCYMQVLVQVLEGCVLHVALVR